ncbi:MAG: response regulator, partial [Candidatus Hydrogenedentes bacterium]|nr:response regulator [Candidatus Hydrogenedentota bacterium]
MTKLPITILIIEDERILRESLADYLEDRDFRTLTAENGRAGLEVFDQEHPDVVLTDLRMPEMGGLEVLERIGVQSPNIPLIVVSGTGHLGDAVRALRLGAWDYIVKPIDDMDIIGYTIDKVLERARLLQESSDHQEHLEVEVQKRTAELGEANAHLAGINERLRKLVESTHSLSMCDRVDTFGFKLLDEFANHMLATGGSIYLIEEDGLRRLSTLDGDHTSEFIHFPLPVGSVILRVMETKEALLVQDIAQEEDLKPSGWKGYRDQSLLVFPLPDESGSIVGVLTLHNKISPPFIKQDIDVGAILASYCSEMMRAIHATESLRESERHYYSLLNAMSEQILVVNSDLCITGANASAVQAAGEDSEEFLIGKSYHKVAHGRDNPCADTGECCKLEAVFKTGIPCAFRHASRKSGHSDEYMDIVVTPLKDDKGDVLRVIVCARDITKEVTLEEQFRQAQKMDAVGQLAGGVAHDFNNLLQVILGYGDLALDDVEEGSSVRESLDEILEAGNRARILVSQLLAFSRRQVLDMEDLDINSVISDTLKMLRRLIGEHIHLDFLSGQELDTIRADLGQIGQILTNLCINARDAMPSGGTITIETENISLDEAYC